MFGEASAIVNTLVDNVITHRGYALKKNKTTVGDLFVELIYKPIAHTSTKLGSVTTTQSDSKTPFPPGKSNVIPVDKGQIGALTVKVIKGKDLMDTNAMAKNDPYVILELGNGKQSTVPVEDTPNPEWNKSFNFPVLDREGILKISVINNAAVQEENSDYSIGECYLHIKELADNTHSEKCYKLHKFDDNASNNEKDSKGEVYLHCTYIPKAESKTGTSQTTVTAPVTTSGSITQNVVTSTVRTPRTNSTGVKEQVGPNDQSKSIASKSTSVPDEIGKLNVVVNKCDLMSSDVGEWAKPNCYIILELEENHSKKRALYIRN